MYTPKFPIAALLLLPAALSAAQLDPAFTAQARALVGRTQDDLRKAADFERHNGKDAHRYESTQKALSDFDRELTKGHFEKGKLNASLHDLKHVAEHNVLDPEGRDALRNDLAGLTDLRDRREHRH